MHRYAPWTRIYMSAFGIQMNLSANLGFMVSTDGFVSNDPYNDGGRPAGWTDLSPINNCMMPVGRVK